MALIVSMYTGKKICFTMKIVSYISLNFLQGKYNPEKPSFLMAWQTIKSISYLYIYLYLYLYLYLELYLYLHLLLYLYLLIPTISMSLCVYISQRYLGAQKHLKLYLINVFVSCLIVVG